MLKLILNNTIYLMPCILHFLLISILVNTITSLMKIYITNFTINISSLQAHFDELNEFLSKFSHPPPSIIFLTETRIYSNPTINVNIPGYTFLHKPTSTKAGGVGAYVSNNPKFSENETLNLNIEGCQNLWLEVELQRQRPKHIFTVVYRHPCNNKPHFLKAWMKSFKV